MLGISIFSSSSSLSFSCSLSTKITQAEEEGGPKTENGAKEAAEAEAQDLGARSVGGEEEEEEEERLLFDQGS